jgi:plastocyanin domain-containing protein
MTSLFINLICLVLIILIVWWFWLSKSKPPSSEVKKLIEIYVKNGVYQPATISAKANKPIILRFIREDASPCAEIVVFSSLNISQQLPIHKPTDINLNIKNAGQYEFTCQMGMYRGMLIVI